MLEKNECNNIDKEKEDISEKEAADDAKEKMVAEETKKTITP